MDPFGIRWIYCFHGEGLLKGAQDESESGTDPPFKAEATEIGAVKSMVPSFWTWKGTVGLEV